MTAADYHKKSAVIRVTTSDWHVFLLQTKSVLPHVFTDDQNYFFTTIFMYILYIHIQLNYNCMQLHVWQIKRIILIFLLLNNDDTIYMRRYRVKMALTFTCNLLYFISDFADSQQWILAINKASARYSAPPLAAPIGSRYVHIDECIM